VCVPKCPSEALSLAKRPDPPEPASNLTDLITRIAAEKDRLKHYMG